MFLRLCDFGMIMVWWFESGLIEWLWCDGLEVVYAKENNWRNCKQLWTKYAHFFLVFFKLRNTTQSTSLSFRFLQLFHFTTWLENFLKTSEDQVIKPSVVIRLDVVYPRVSLKTLKTFINCIILWYRNIKKNTFALQGLQISPGIHDIKPNHDWRCNDLVSGGIQDILESRCEV